MYRRGEDRSSGEERTSCSILFVWVKFLLVVFALKKYNVVKGLKYHANTKHVFGLAGTMKMKELKMERKLIWAAFLE